MPGFSLSARLPHRWPRWASAEGRPPHAKRELAADLWVASSGVSGVTKASLFCVLSAMWPSRSC